MTSEESFFTRAPITPSEVRRRYSNGRDLEVVFRKGYKNSGMCAEEVRQFVISSRVESGRLLPFKNKARVSW